MTDNNEGKPQPDLEQSCRNNVPEATSTSGGCDDQSKQLPFYKKHWFGGGLAMLGIVVIISWFASANIVWNWCITVASVVFSAIGVWMVGSTDKKESRKFSWEKVLALIAYILSFGAFVVLFHQVLL